MNEVQRMISKKLVAALLVASTGVMSTLASADPWQDQNGRHGQQQNWDHGPNRDHGRDRGPGPQFDQNRYQHYRDHSNGGSWQRGDRLPPNYRGASHRVNDWRGRGLPPPPRGHRWVQANGQYILVAVATGVIASILLHR